jgi:polyphosphate kinase
MPYLHDACDAWAQQSDGRYVRIDTEGPSAQQALLTRYRAGHA